MKKILVIEDEEPVLAGIVALLTAEDFEAKGAENGLLGLRRAREYLPDLIVCDVMMPKLDGYGVLAELRKSPETATIPFIFLSAKSTKEDLRRGMQLGADDYLTKPFTRDELLGAIAARFKKHERAIEQYTTELKQKEEQLNYLIYHDRLTSLPNRLSLQEQFHQAIAPSASNNQLIYILSISLDRFSYINDTLGYLAGDLLLKAVTKRLKSCVSGNDTVARLQADQFVIILITADREQAAVDVAQNILTALSQPFMLDGREIFIKASIGIALYPQSGTNIDILVENAAIAMFHAKKHGGNACQFYTRDLRVSSADTLALETSLRYAVERTEFQVYYQPKVDLLTGKIVGVEALLRWQHPERGPVSPATFIPIAEETGAIVAIGEWVLRTACRQTKAWQTVGFSSIRVAVNLSCRQFSQPNLGDSIIEILKETNLDPQFLELEITESVLMLDREAATKTLNELKALGIKISIDDFGTGYSSLSYLKRFSFDTLKIDRCFIRNITNDARNKTITSAIIEMAHSLNLIAIAEGVETPEELRFLYQHHCDEIQGYLFCRPIPPEELEKLLSADKRLQIPSW